MARGKLDTTGQQARDIRVRTLLNARGLGFSLLRAWVYLLFLDSSSTFINQTGGDWGAYSYQFSIIALTVTLFASAVVSRTRSLYHIPRDAFYIAPLAACIGTVCIALAGIEDMPGFALCAIGGICTGVGSGLIDLGYGQLYRNEESVRTTLEVPLSFFIAAVIFSITLPLPPLASSVICSLLPVASAVLLMRLLPQEASGTVAQQPTAQIDILPFAWRIGACACLVGIGDGIVRAQCLSATGLSATEFYQAPLVVGALVTLAIIYICLAVSFFTKGNANQDGLRQVYRSAVFVMAVFYLCLPLMHGVSFLECTVALAGYGTFNVLIWLVLATVSHRYQLDAPVVFGIGWGMVSLGVLLGVLIGQAVVASQLSTSAVAAIATICILISYLFLFREADIAQIVTPSELVAFGATTVDDTESVPAFIADELGMHAGCADGDDAVGDDDDVSDEDAGDGMARLRAVTDPDAPGGAGMPGNAHEDGLDAPGDSEGSEAPDSPTAGIDGDAGADTEASSAGIPRKMRFMDSCDLVAQRYGLSPKEKEIMILYAKGRSSTVIQQELYLSRGTVTTHLRHIYQKMDIHSKQELYAVIESCRTGQG